MNTSLFAEPTGRGYITVVQNTKNSNYLDMAYAMALSIKNTQPEGYNNISIVCDDTTTVPKKYKKVFDHIIPMPWGDNAKDSAWKLENEWKVYHCTPYEETIKLDADMLFLSDQSFLWSFGKQFDIYPCTTVKTYRNEIITNDFYRKTFTSNSLPNIYSALFYFKKTDQAQEFFDLVELITYNREKFFYEFLDHTRPLYFSTDVAYALAYKILFGDIKTSTEFCFTHMKTKLQNWNDDLDDEDWTKYININFSNVYGLKLDMMNQKNILHYHVKHFLNKDIIKKLETACKNKI